MNIEKKLLSTVIVLLSIIAIGCSGYIFIEKWTFLEALYMTIITIATVGFMEVRPLSEAGRIFTIILILGGTSFLVYAGSFLIAFVVEGELKGILGRRKMEKLISQLTDHYIICGVGATGRYVVEEFMATKQKFVVVERDLEKLKQVKNYETIVFIQGDATSDKTLEASGIKKAKGLVSVLPTDEDNVFVTLTAKSLNPGLRIVAKAIEDEAVYKMKIAGAAAVVSPNNIGGLRIASEALRPTVTSFLDTMLRDKDSTLRIAEIAINAASKAVGKTIGELDVHKKFGILVLSIKSKESNEYIFNPKTELKLSDNDILIVMATPEQIEKLRVEIN